MNGCTHRMCICILDVNAFGPVSRSIDGACAGKFIYLLHIYFVSLGPGCRPELAYTESSTPLLSEYTLAK
jgi:hypothetical protein